MDKIVYTCSAEHIGYTFPRRKWWDFSKKQREMNFELAAGLADEDIVVYVRILEKYSMESGPQKNSCRNRILGSLKNTSQVMMSGSQKLTGNRSGAHLQKRS